MFFDDDGDEEKHKCASVGLGTQWLVFSLKNCACHIFISMNMIENVPNCFHGNDTTGQFGLACWVTFMWIIKDRKDDGKWWMGDRVRSFYDAYTLHATARTGKWRSAYERQSGSPGNITNWRFKILLADQPTGTQSRASSWLVPSGPLITGESPVVLAETGDTRQHGTSSRYSDNSGMFWPAAVTVRRC